MLLRPTTPPGSPVPTLVEPPGWLQRVGNSVLGWLHSRATLIIEAQDVPGRIATVAYAASTLSATFAYAITLQLIQPHGAEWAVVHFLLRHFGGAAIAVAWGAGFLSTRRLPRLLAWTIVVTAACFYGWDRVNLPGRVFPWNFITHIVFGVTLALPNLLAWAHRRFHDDTA